MSTQRTGSGARGDDGAVAGREPAGDVAAARLTVPGAELAQRLRLMVLTRPRPACGRPLIEVVEACLAAGATAIQLRDKEAGSAELLAMARELAPAVRAGGGLFLVNDRLDVALLAGADGVHLGPDDLPIEAARAVAPPGFLVGFSTDDPRTGRRAAAAGADYLGIGAVYGTASKPEAAGEAIGPDRVEEVLAASGIPGVGIGGIMAANAGAVAAAGAGIAVLSAVMDAQDPPVAVQALLAATKRGG